MSKTAKTLIGLIGGGLVIAVIAVWLLASNLDSIVKRIVEDVGTETLGTDVKLSSAEIALTDAKATLRGLAIANPPGFQEPKAFELGGIAVKLDPKSISGKEIIMRSIVIDDAVLTFEQIGEQNNLQSLMDNLDSAGDEATTENATDSGEELLIVIEELQLNGANMTMIVDRLSEPLSVTLDNITVRNIGRPGAGVTPEQAAEQIIEPILKQAEDQALDRIKEKLKKGALEKAGEKTDKFLNSAKDKLFGD